MSRSLGWTLLTTRSPIEIVPEVMFSSPREHPQQGRFAAAGGANQHDERTILDRDTYAMQDFKAAKRFPNVANLHRRHTIPLHVSRHCTAKAVAALFFNFDAEVEPNGHCPQFKL